MSIHRILSSLIATTILLTTATVRSESRNYFQAVGYVVAQIRYVKWMGELCSERFPEMKAKNTAAYMDWKTHNIAFINEMEGQFSVMKRHLSNFSPGGANIESAIRSMSDGIDAQRQAVKRENEAHGESTYRWMCQLYPERIASRTNDLEAELADPVATVRRGPQP